MGYSMDVYVIDIQENVACVELMGEIYSDK